MKHENILSKGVKAPSVILIHLVLTHLSVYLWGTFFVHEMFCCLFLTIMTMYFCLYKVNFNSILRAAEDI